MLSGELSAMPIPIPYLEECFNMNPETGILTWLGRPVEHFPSERGWKIFNTRFAGKEVGYSHNMGYLEVKLTYEGKTHRLLAHRIVFAMHYKRWPDPDKEIDHRNLQKADNRISNLREVTPSENQHNRGAQKNNTSGIKGVSVLKTRKHTYWQSHFSDGGKPHRKYFPYTDEGLQKAIAQRKAWEKEYITL